MINDSTNLTASLPAVKGCARGLTPRDEAGAASMLTYQQAADYLTISRRTLERLVKRKRVKAIRLSARCIRFTQGDLESFKSKCATIREARL